MFSKIPRLTLIQLYSKYYKVFIEIVWPRTLSLSDRAGQVHETVAALAADGFTIHPEVPTNIAESDSSQLRALIRQQ